MYASATGFSRIAPTVLPLFTDKIVSGNLFNEVTSAFSISVLAIFSWSVPFWTAIFLSLKSLIVLVIIYGLVKLTSFSRSGVVVIPEIIISILPVLSAPSKLSNCILIIFSLRWLSLAIFLANSISTPAYSVFPFAFFSNSIGA